MSRARPADQLIDAVDPDNSDALAEAVENALAAADSEETRYWIRTLLQHIIVEAETTA